MTHLWKTIGTVLLLAAVLSSGLFIGYAMARQPRMEGALRALREARSELQAARANKGGHRVKAMRLIDQAMYEVREGIRHAE
ncbi:MAG: hypothetical protein H6924_02715 [Alphaproteobacteria bacterium]|nr:hypothetical protein [Alphaproteobacteria bacterium]